MVPGDAGDGYCAYPGGAGRVPANYLSIQYFRREVIFLYLASKLLFLAQKSL